MVERILIKSKNISNNTLANLETRDVALWVHGLQFEADQLELLTSFLGLPWRLVIFEGMNADLLQMIQDLTRVEDPMARKRGLIQIIDSDPSRIDLPPRCLPIYLLDGKQGCSDFDNTLNRMTMLENFRRSGVRDVIVLSSGTPLIPKFLNEVWSAGFRAYLTFGSDSQSAESELQHWIDDSKDSPTTTLIQLSPQAFIQDIYSKYNEIYPEERRIIRLRDSHGDIYKVDITNADETERPILDLFSLIEERDLSPLSPMELSEEEFIAFFKNPEQSWRPYAANLPWLRDTDVKDSFRKCLRKLETQGSDENCIAFISSESGAGGTTMARTLAWSFAREGYPVLLAKSYPFLPEALPVFNYLMRVQRIFKEKLEEAEKLVEKLGSFQDDQGIEKLSKEHRTETPWILVFDTQHWQNRDTELTQFRNMLAQYGKPVCILVVTGSSLSLPFQISSVYKKLAELHHTIGVKDAKQLGQHLNEFLRYYGRERSEIQWEQFYSDHTIKNAGGIASFWVTLSFWIQRQYDLSESIQQWIYSTFKNQGGDIKVQEAILQIAAMSSERLPLPQSLLPEATDRWPVWVHLEDEADELSRLGLTQINAQGERYWAIIHDILGRLLINAIFYDTPMRQAMGFPESRDPEHFRFQILQKISKNRLLGERNYRSIGEDFAIDIFKIDPDQGKNSFAAMWRDVLDALDNMPQSLRDNSRLFRHHTSISRRRIVKLESIFYNIDDLTRMNLLERAINDIKYALTEIPFTTGSESNLNMLNSLAHAYLDLANVKEKLEAPAEEIVKLKALANETARQAYRESPNNSFVLETYIQNLLQSAKDTPQLAVVSCVEALGVLYSVLSDENYRTSALDRLANLALEILFKQSPTDTLTREPKNALDMLVQAWLLLTNDRNLVSEWSLDNVPRGKQESALQFLSNPIGNGNLQILRLRYDLICSIHPYAFKEQIDTLEPLRVSDSWISPQTQLEYGILLFQVGRINEGERLFRSLRRLWREGEQYVYVPERLRWLRTVDQKTAQIVHATIASESDTRPFAIVREFANARVPIRPEEHGLINPKPGLSFSCFVSFTINGPFLRPLSSQPTVI